MDPVLSEGNDEDGHMSESSSYPTEVMNKTALSKQFAEHGNQLLSDIEGVSVENVTIDVVSPPHLPWEVCFTVSTPYGKHKCYYHPKSLLNEGIVEKVVNPLKIAVKINLAKRC